MDITNAICLKFGTLYGPQYVNRLFAGLRRNCATPLRFVCMTDDPRGLDSGIDAIPLPREPYHDRLFGEMARHGWRAPFQKISMFKPDLLPNLQGPLLIFDIDVVITGDIAALRDHAPGKVCMRRERSHRPGFRSLGHGSVEKIEPVRHAYLYASIAQEPEKWLAMFGPSEQNYTSHRADLEGDFEFFPDDWVVSFKHDCRPRRPLNLFLEPHLPPKAKVVCFHGRPKMEEAVVGYKSDLLHSTRPCSWMRQAWIGEETAQIAVPIAG
jgi:hypothetical protein